MEATLYQDIAGRVRADIDDGTYAPGSQLPSCKALAERYDVGTDIVKHAYRLLQNEGRVEVVAAYTRVVQTPEYQKVVVLPAGAEVTVRMPTPKEQQLYGIGRPGVPIFVVSVPGVPDEIYAGDRSKLVVTGTDPA